MNRTVDHGTRALPICGISLGFENLPGGVVFTCYHNKHPPAHTRLIGPAQTIDHVHHAFPLEDAASVLCRQDLRNLHDSRYRCMKCLTGGFETGCITDNAHLAEVGGEVPRQFSEKGRSVFDKLSCSSFSDHPEIFKTRGLPARLTAPGKAFSLSPFGPVASRYPHPAWLDAPSRPTQQGVPPMFSTFSQRLLLVKRRIEPSLKVDQTRICGSTDS